MEPGIDHGLLAKPPRRRDFRFRHFRFRLRRRRRFAPLSSSASFDFDFDFDGGSGDPPRRVEHAVEDDVLCAGQDRRGERDDACSFGGWEFIEKVRGRERKR